MELMASTADNYYDLAIVDPPYGIGKHGQKESTGGHGGRKSHKIKDWDNYIPNEKYFTELFRISKNQIIWGANYYPQYLTGTMGWVFWDKGQDLNQSDGELAFTSFDRAFRRVIINRVELLKEGTIHPTQKPIKLYRWLLQNYAKAGQRILDTHGGSFSSAVACHTEGFEMDIIEIDEEYYNAGIKRFKEATCQLKIF
uniref:Putative methyltransferase n=1 Tax=viral metagenome TaxID=1070528 RepID=A0A6M3LVI8_9ZZZZ